MSAPRSVHEAATGAGGMSVEDFVKTDEYAAGVADGSIEAWVRTGGTPEAEAQADAAPAAEPEQAAEVVPEPEPAAEAPAE